MSPCNCSTTKPVKNVTGTGGIAAEGVAGGAAAAGGDSGGGGGARGRAGVFTILLCHTILYYILYCIL